MPVSSTPLPWLPETADRRKLPLVSDTAVGGFGAMGSSGGGAERQGEPGAMEKGGEEVRRGGEEERRMGVGGRGKER